MPDGAEATSRIQASRSQYPISFKNREGERCQLRYLAARDKMSVCFVRVTATKQFRRSSSISGEVGPFWTL